MSDIYKEHYIYIWVNIYRVIYTLLLLCRCFFLDKLQEKLPSDQANDSMEVDGECSGGDQMEVDQHGESIHSMIKSCKFNMKMKMIESARKQVNILSDNFQFAEKIHRKNWKSLLGGLWYPFARANLVSLWPYCPGHFESSRKSVPQWKKRKGQMLIMKLMVICHYWKCAWSPLWSTDGFGHTKGQMQYLKCFSL